MVAFYETVTKQLFCDLQEHERRDRAMTLAGQISALKETKLRHDSQRQTMKKAEDVLSNSIASLSDVVENRRELRDVTCKWEFQLNGPKDSIARLLRADTGKEVETHVMEPHEYDEVRQLRLDNGATDVPSSIEDATVPSGDELKALLTKHGGNTTKASEERGVSRRTLNRWLDSRNIDATDYRVKA